MNKVIATAVLAAVVLTGCNTFKGLGKDVQAGGEKVQQAAVTTQQKL